MGCGSSKAKAETGAEARQSPQDKTLTTAELKEADESQSIRSIKSTTKSWTNGMPTSSSTPETQIPGNVPEPVSFEIPALNEEDSIIKKHPPKRLQKLEDQQVNLTQDLLEDKQQEVEDRRQKLLEDRVQSTRRSAHYRRQRVIGHLSPDQIEESTVEGEPVKEEGEEVSDI